MSERHSPIAVSLDDYERAALSKLTPNAAAYLAGGAGDEITMRWNRNAFARYAIMPRVLRRSELPSTSSYLFGSQLVHPIIVAPVAFQKLAHPDGEAATVLGAAAQDAMMVLSTLATITIEQAAKDGPTCRWFQLYIQKKRDETIALVRRAEQAGFEALVVTVDAPLSGVRNREQRIGFQLPFGISAVNISQEPSATVGVDSAISQVFTEFLRVAPSWDDLAWLVTQTQLPVIVKGIAHRADARHAIEAGAQGIIVSNHGGRTLDTVPASIDLLPAIVEEVGSEIPVLVDGGVRRGTDVFKCLALGARAVMVGRPIVYGLAVGGALGVSHVLRILRDELEITMLLAGCMTLAEINRNAVIRAAT